MNTPSFRDVEQLSAYLDGNLSEAETARLETRLRSEPALEAVLEELRQARTVLRRTPQRRAPRNFTLTPKMAGLRPPVPRAVPVLSWASAVAMLLFVCSLGTSLLGRLPLGAGAPLMVAAPASRGSGTASDSGAQEYGIGGGPPPTEAPAALPAAPQLTLTPGEIMPFAPLQTPTGETANLQAPAATAAPVELTSVQPPAAKNPVPLADLWPYGLLGLAVLLIGAALAVRWGGVLRLRRRVESRK
jgi:hypothetical protein